MSGAIGTHSGIGPEVERRALLTLGLKPYSAATQILPRLLYSPVASALAQLVKALDKVATDIRLGARSGYPIYQEPFGKGQTGSSAMPHKKNIIVTENIEGMSRLADGYALAIEANSKTWEERAIEQSSVERVAWPDLLHVTVYALRRMRAVLTDFVVYPDNMLREIRESRGCYASNEAKDMLAKLGERVGLSTEECYRIVQLAAFNVFEPNKELQELRDIRAASLEEADDLLHQMMWLEPVTPRHLYDVVRMAQLYVSSQLEATPEQVGQWNDNLRKLFEDILVRDAWKQAFKPSYLLRNLDHSFEQVLGK